MQYKSLKKDYEYRFESKKKNTTLKFLKNLQKTFIDHPQLTTTQAVATTRKSKIKNICLSSGLERSTNLSFFGSSRHIFKIKNIKLSYPGLRKASW